MNKLTEYTEIEQIQKINELVDKTNELDSKKAPLASPALTGTPTAPTPSSTDSSTQIATTAFVDSKVGSGIANLATGAASSIDNHIAIFDGTTGKKIKDSGFTIASNVPTNAKFTDTTNTAGSTDTSSKIFLIGATSQAAAPQTYSHNTAYVGTDGCLYSNNTKVSVEGHGHNYLPLSGGAITGSIRCKTTYSNGSGTTYTSDVITFNTSNTNYGNNVAFGGSGNTVVGAGESYSVQLSQLSGSSSENCYICADDTVYIKTNCNTFANAKTYTFTTDGKITFPNGAQFWIA